MPVSKNYQLALSFTDRLSDDGYANMIKRGILNGIERLKLLNESKQKASKLKIKGSGTM
ncbi:hypothetical protein ACF3OC_09340 [Sphingobacterium cellulitidis]|uniref:hypothetical protein n=1 Tax=Sphingobacterium cellulitidis TaxID=1768011 RepID=UPI00370DE087